MVELTPSDLITRREDQWFDRKSGRIQARALADVILGMANAEGGVIAVGLSDGRFEGLGNVDQNALRQAARDYCLPPVRHSYRVSKVGQDEEVVIIEVEASEQVHRNVKDEVFLRVGDENRRLTSFEAQELEYDKGQSAYDGRFAPGTSLADLDSELVASLQSRLGISTPVQEALQARGLLLRTNDNWSPTVAGLIMLGRAPQEHMPEAFVRVVTYRGRAREVGAGANVVRDARFDGPIPRQLDELRPYLRSQISTEIRLRREGKFEATPTLPEDAWLEAVVNAVIHRSYSMGGDHVRVEVFDDRLEVESPGRLPGLVRIDNIRSTRFARNPRIARAMAEFGFGRELGEGVDRIFEEMQRNGLPDPIYEQRPASVKVTLLSDARLSPLLEGLPRDARFLAEYASRVGRLTTSEATQVLGVSRPTALRTLKLLADRGIVSHVGNSMNDPRSFWQFAAQ